MNTAETLLPETRKRLGQFFTGDRLARLLAALADAEHAHIVIDPMGGSGDMIEGVLAVSTGREQFAAVIEIEPVAASACAKRHGDAATIIHGNAFDPRSWLDLPRRWDLVITNPPYVRYQIGSDEGAGGLNIPSAEEVRSGLMQILAADPALSSSERVAFLHCAQRYSGLADLAVPSWILCASKVDIGGRLAVIVPNTWLSRDYAAPVLYVLRRFFDIEYVVEDKDAAWFDNALVRTTLVIARRTSDKGTAFAPGSHLHLALPKSAADQQSLVGAIFRGVDQPELQFAKEAADALCSVASGDVAGIKAEVSNESDLLDMLRRVGGRQPWPCTVDVCADSGGAVPERLRRLVPDHPIKITTLDDIGWKVGQGLRTGGNDFFYVTRVAPGRYQSTILPDKILRLPDDAVRPAVRRQVELPATGVPAKVTETTSYVLVLDAWALAEDIKRAVGPNPWKPMTGDLELLVRSAAVFQYERGNTKVLLPMLSAVRTNVRSASKHTESAARFWYHLPPLAPRHIPALYVPRVNNRHPSAFANFDGFVIDANFSSLWPSANDALPAPALLALLRSKWTVCALEIMGTVLGGGALKVEATHLRRLPLPSVTTNHVEALNELGAELLHSGSADTVAINEVVSDAIGSDQPTSVSAAIDSLATSLLDARIGGLSS